MRNTALGIVAAPLLVAQGLWVRHATPELPEAQGPREGVLGDGVPLRLLIVGDSSAAGVGARHQDEALAGRLVAALGAGGGAAVHWRLLARSGATTRDLVGLLAVAGPLAFDVALIVAGVNDVTGLRSRRAWLADLDALAQRLRASERGARLLASGLPPVHRFPALPQPLRAFLGGRAIAFDRALAAWAARQPDAIHVPIPDIDDPSLAASDGFHPGPGAYAVWADALAAAMRERGYFGGSVATKASPVSTQRARSASDSKPGGSTYT